MNQIFQGWEAVAEQLRQQAEAQEQLALRKGEEATRLNQGQRASLRAIASRIVNNGVVIADEVGMGKTRIAVEVARCVILRGGRVAILVPPGLGYQWQTELRDGEINDVPPILRSLYAYLLAWDGDPEPWFAKQAVMVSHAFTNWRIGENAAVWRWALVPELYACWREMIDSRLPRGYHSSGTLSDGVCRAAAKSIAAAVPKNRQHPVRRLLDQFENVQWPRPLDAAEYSKHGALREWLERSVGIGLGVFDLIITDEAHKGRGTESGLSRLLERVIVSSDAARRLALTATPVELDVSQWHSTLSRLGLNAEALATVQEATSQYADAVRRVRQAWRSSPEAREAYTIAANRFRETLSPFLLRRDKREDPEVLRFFQHSGLPINAYRKMIDLSVNTVDLSTAWRKAICAAESLSVVTRQSDDPVAKRLRLTLGNGHGIAALLDQMKRGDDDDRQERFDGTDPVTEQKEEAESAVEVKRQERAEWWLNTISQAFDQGDESLFEHPAIKKAVEAIETETQRDEKVLVFGRFTRPLRALVDLLNAREMLRRVQNEEPWPQSKVHGDRDGDAENSEWLAVRAAHRQIMSPLQLETLDETLRARYERERQRREDFRERMIPEIDRGLQEHNAGANFRAIFDAFTRSIDANIPGERADQGSLALVARAMMELLESPDAGASDYASTFCQLIEAVCDTDDADAEDNEIEADEAAKLWNEIETRLRDEYTRTQGGFARLMYGGTSPESRRMIQLAFNRARSFPKVLVAQSLVGREGLNLHKSCRIVMLLHPEWNPGVVEQQIGRIDRVDSRWCKELRKALESDTPAERLPRIEVRPVIFQGTYDEHNWKVLRERWDNLRAQLHGAVISAEFAGVNNEDQALFDEISNAAPNFSPNRSDKQGF
jgi:superfamily II DNA or RNA helicase